MTTTPVDILAALRGAHDVATDVSALGVNLVSVTTAPGGDVSMHIDFADDVHTARGVVDALGWEIVRVNDRADSTSGPFSSVTATVHGRAVTILGRYAPQPVVEVLP